MLTIVWDVDDVLNDLMRTWFERDWLPKHPRCPLSYQNLTKNPPCEILGISLDEYLSSLDAFRLATQMRDLAPIPEAKRWFEQYGSRHRHVALTAVPFRCAPASASWVLAHFGEWIRSFHFVPSARAGEILPVYDETKVDFLRSLSEQHVLVDDREENVNAAKEIGLRACLVPRPWNSGQQNIEDSFQKLAQL